MTDRAEPAKPWDAINLAAVPDFALGSLLVQLSRRRVSAGAIEKSVEPRVMQSLIALAKAGGAVVSRELLIDRCWGGRIVGEDAINRCIAKVRRLAEATQPPAFTIETVSRVGYRLQVLGETSCASASAALADPSALSEFREATELDPEFALALVGIADVLTFQINYGMSTAEPAHSAALREARRDAERAIALAPGLGLPHAQLAMVLHTGLNDMSAAWSEAV